MTTCLHSCDMNTIGDAGVLHGNFASATNRVHIA